MRKLNPKRKEKRKVHVPAELRESMRGVRGAIEESVRDPDNLPIDYGDAIQVGPFAVDALVHQGVHSNSHTILKAMLATGGGSSLFTKQK